MGSAASEPLQLNITVIRTKAMMPVNRCRTIPTVPVLAASRGHVHNQPEAFFTPNHVNNHCTLLLSRSLAEI